MVHRPHEWWALLKEALCCWFSLHNDAFSIVHLLCLCVAEVVRGSTAEVMAHGSAMTWQHLQNCVCTISDTFDSISHGPMLCHWSSLRQSAKFFAYTSFLYCPREIYCILLSHIKLQILHFWNMYMLYSDTNGSHDTNADCDGTTEDDRTPSHSVQRSERCDTVILLGTNKGKLWNTCHGFIKEAFDLWYGTRMITSVSRLGRYLGAAHRWMHLL